MPESVGRLSFTGENESYGSSRRGKQERVSLLAGRGRDRGGVDCEDDAKRILAELFAGAVEALRPQVVDGGDFAPVEGREGKSEGGCLPRSLRRRFGGGARARQETLQKGESVRDTWDRHAIMKGATEVRMYFGVDSLVMNPRVADGF